MACELHLGNYPLTDDAWLEVDRFLLKSTTTTTTTSSTDAVDATTESDAAAAAPTVTALTSTTSSTNKPVDRLFVWTAKGETVAHAATEHWPKAALRQTAAVVFVRAVDVAATAEITDRRHIQCMTLQPALALEEAVTKNGDDFAVQQQQQQQQSPDAVLHTLQMYASQCFLPAVQAVLDADSEAAAALQDKIRELTVALQQTARSARLPRVVLQVHAVILAAVPKRAGDKLDWEALGLLDQLQDDGFLNTLQASVSQWITQICKITVLPKSTLFPAESAQAAFDEVAFWTQLQAELQSVQQQLRDPGVELTVQLLREAKRFVATLALENNTGLEQAVAVTTDMCNFIKQYPVQQLQSARDFDKIAAAMAAIFDYLPKIRQSRYYSLDRSVQLLEATTAALRDCILAVLQEQYSNLLFLDYKDYENKVRFPVLDVFVQFEDRLEEWKDFLLEQGRRRKLPGMSKILDKIVLHHLPLKERLEQIHEFRSQQERLREVVHTVLREEEPAAIQQVDQAPRQIFATLNVLDLSSGGGKMLDSALEEYDLQMDALEERLARLLRDKLTACQVGALIVELFYMSHLVRLCTDKCQTILFRLLY